MGLIGWPVAAALAVLAAPAVVLSEEPADAPDEALEAARVVERAIQRAAERVGPAVVNLGVVREVTADLWNREGGVPDWLPDELRDRLREYFQWREDRGLREPFRT